MAEADGAAWALGISVDGLACRRAGRLVFRDLAFSVPPGGALLLRGANGSGKSTLLRVLAGLLPAAAGDRPSLEPNVVHYVGHADPLKPALTVEENLGFVTAVLGGGDVQAGLAAFALARLREAPARHLSSGQRRRLTLARLASVRRPIWLLDEPAVGLDANNRARLEGLIAGHRTMGGCVVAATHGDIAIADATLLEMVS